MKTSLCFARNIRMQSQKISKKIAQKVAYMIHGTMQIDIIVSINQNMSCVDEIC